MAWSGLDATTVVSVYSAGYGAGPNVGLQREDLLDLITNIDPWDNIVFAMLPKRRARSTTHEWPADVLPTVARAGVPDGADFSAQTITQPWRLKNYTQIFRWDVQVTGTEQEVDVAGMGDRLAYQILNGTHAMAKAVEQRIFDIGTTGTALQFTADLAGSFVNMAGAGTAACPGYGGAPALGAGGTATTGGRRFAPLYQLVNRSGTPFADPFITASDGTLSATNVDDAVEKMFGNGLSPETLVLNQGSKRDLANDLVATSANSYINTRMIQATERKVIRGVDVYEGELATLSVIPNRSIPIGASGAGGYGTAWVIQKDMLGIAFLRPIKATPLSKTGDSEKTMLLGELTLQLNHPAGVGGVTKISS